MSKPKWLPSNWSGRLASRAVECSFCWERWATWYLTSPGRYLKLCEDPECIALAKHACGYDGDD